MSNAFTLDDLNTAIEKKYAPFVFQAGEQKFIFTQILRLPKEKRDIVRAQLESLESHKDNISEEEVFAILKAVLQNVIEGDKVDALLNILDHDLVKITLLVEKWAESASVGEA